MREGGVTTAGLFSALRRRLGAFGLPALSGPSAQARGELLERLPLLARLGESEMRAALTARYEERCAGALRGSGSGFPLVDFLGSVGGFIDGHLLLAPYVGVHGYSGRERKKTRALRHELLPDSREDRKVALFVDGLDGIHGVATMYKNLQSSLLHSTPGVSRRFAAETRSDPKPEKRSRCTS